MSSKKTSRFSKAIDAAYDVSNANNSVFTNQQYAALKALAAICGDHFYKIPKSKNKNGDDKVFTDEDLKKFFTEKWLKKQNAEQRKALLKALNDCKLDHSIIQDRAGKFYAIHEKIGASVSTIKSLRKLTDKKKQEPLLAVKIMKESDITEDFSNTEKKLYSRESFKKSKKANSLLKSFFLGWMYRGGQEANKDKGYILMKQARGQTLTQEMNELKKKDIFFSLNEANVRVQGIIESISQMHKQGIIHRDIKCSNIMYDSKTQTTTLIDFDDSRKLWPIIKMHFGSYVIGTKGYVAPELEERKNIDDELFPYYLYTEKTDLFAMVKTIADIYELGAGMIKRNDQPLYTINKDTTLETKVYCYEPIQDSANEDIKKICNLINRGLSRNPKERPGLKEWRAALSASNTLDQSIKGKTMKNK